jgi:hypothetical protein
MSRIRSAYEAHESIIVALDRKRNAAAPRRRRDIGMALIGAATGAALAAVWIAAALLGGL